MEGYTMRHWRFDKYGNPLSAISDIPDDYTFPQMLALARKTADITGYPATIIDDDGEEVCTIGQ